MVDYLKQKYGVPESFVPAVTPPDKYLSRGGSVSMPAMDMGVMPKGQSMSQAEVFDRVSKAKQAC